MALAAPRIDREVYFMLNHNNKCTKAVFSSEFFYFLRIFTNVPWRCQGLAMGTAG